MLFACVFSLEFSTFSQLHLHCLLAFAFFYFYFWFRLFFCGEVNRTLFHVQLLLRVLLFITRYLIWDTFESVIKFQLNFMIKIVELIWHFRNAVGTGCEMWIRMWIVYDFSWSLRSWNFPDIIADRTESMSNNSQYIRVSLNHGDYSNSLNHECQCHSMDSMHISMVFLRKIHPKCLIRTSCV